MKKKIGFWEVYSIGVGGMIGGGIFATLGLSLELAGGAAPVAFIFAGIIALLTSYSYAKLSARFPSIGGTIEFLVRAYGDNVFSGGLNIMLLASYIVMIALYAYAFGAYGASMLPSFYREAYIILVVFAIGSLVLVNFLGAVVSGRVELALVVFKLSVLLFITAIGFGQVDWDRLSPNQWPSLFSIIAGGMIIFLAYEGFELIANTAGDVDNTTILRRAFYSSVSTVIAIYTLIALVSAGALTPEVVREARDYALAMLAKPVLGEVGVTLVVAAALASTSSAINATLYGTARMSYLIAKYGEAPQLLARRVWKGAYEGLLVIGVLSLILALGASLEEISAAGSGGFLIIFTSINIAAYRLRKTIGANASLTISGALLSAMALLILIWRMYMVNPSQLTVLAIIALGSITVEYIYRRATGRKLPETIDPRLRDREAILSRWEEIAGKTAMVIKRLLREVEVHIIGSHARRESHKADDIDILIVTPEPISKEDRKRLERIIEEELSLPPNHPIHIHTTIKKRVERYKERRPL